MKGFLLGPKNFKNEERLILEEGKKVFEKIFYVPLNKVYIRNSKVFYKSKNLENYDFVIPRIPRSYLHLGYNILSLLKEKLYMPILPESLFLAHNKFLTLILLAESKITVPLTFLSMQRKNFENILKNMEFPIVVKNLYGSLGKGIVFADSIESAKSLLDMIEEKKEPIFLEEFVPNPGEDLRIVYVGEPIGGMKRIAKKDERRTNIGIGGIGKPFNLNRKLRDLAIRVSKIFDMEIFGMDVILNNGKPYVIETNVNVQFQGFMKCTKINVAKKIVDFVKEEIESRGLSSIERFGKWLKSIIS